MPIYGPRGLNDPKSKPFEVSAETDGPVGAINTPSFDAGAPLAHKAAFNVEIAALRAINSVVADWEFYSKRHCCAAYLVQ